MPARKRHQEAKRRERVREVAPADLPMATAEEVAWSEYEIGMAAIRFGHCSCGMGRCCSCGGYDVDGPYCGE